MKVLTINGSPRGKNGYTWWMLERFIKGMTDAGAEVKNVDLVGKKIHHCIGDLSCWFKTPGKCIFDDGMSEIISLIDGADAAVFATPVYVDGMTGLLKNCLDRMIPTVDPHFEMRDGHVRHVPIKKKSIERIALVSVCGFFELDNFDPLVVHMKAICKNMDADFAGAALRPAAPGIIEMSKYRHPFKLRDISKAVQKAGEEFVSTGMISEETSASIAKDIVSKEEYFKMCNKYFDSVCHPRMPPDLSLRGQA